MPASVTELGHGRLLLDLGFRDQAQLIAAYLLPGPDGWTLIETGPTTCGEQLLSGLAAAGVEPTQVRRVLVTHIHLDHAGGLGALAGR
ncbi:MAG: MBL fold metallo-hydrolase, partial [Thermoplasmata archaeon]|nr:MBL fold metallo-hydrolase [Thermoplasmata archaeon]